MGRLQPRIVGSVGLLVALALVPSVAASVGPSGESIRFSLSRGLRASGTISASCVALGAVIADKAAGGFAFRSEGGIVEEYTTEWNFTTITPGNPNGMLVPINGHQNWRSSPVPAGSGHIDWTTPARVRVFQANWVAHPQVPLVPFGASFNTTEVHVGPVGASFDDGAYFVAYDAGPPDEQLSGNVSTREMGIWGWGQEVQAGNGRVSVGGNVTLYLYHANVTVDPGYRHEVPSYWENVTHAETVVVGYERVRIHHALVHLQDFHAELPGPSASVVCAATDARLEGALVAFDAKGTLSYAGENRSFDRRELSLNGAFRLHAAPREVDRGLPGSVDADAAGHFSALGLDFAPVQAPAAAGHVAEKIGFWSLALAAVGSVAFAVKSLLGHYTRLEKPRLLEAGQRAAIHDALRMRPWSRQADLHRLTSLPRSTLRHHLRTLRQHGVIRVDGPPARARYALAGAGAAPVAVLDEGADAVREQVLHGPRRLADVMRALTGLFDVSRQAAWKMVNRARESGRVVTRRSGREVWVWSAPP